MSVNQEKKTSPKTDEQWYAIRVKSNFEFKVFKQLQECEYNVYLPTYQKDSLRKDRKRTLNRPLFPGYLFVHCVMEHKVQLDLYKLRGFYKLLEIGGKPIPIPEQEIKQIKAVTKSGLLANSLKGLVKGDLIKVLEGPLAGITGAYVSEDQDKLKFYVKVSFLDRHLEVELEPHMFEKV